GLRPVADQVRGRHRVVPLDVGVLARHPDVLPRGARGFTVAGDPARESNRARCLDPDAEVVRVAKVAVQGADALDDHDPLRDDDPLVRERRPRGPVVAAVARLAARAERLDHLAVEARELEIGAVPELVRADHLRAPEPPGERRLPSPAAAADPDEVEARAGLAHGAEPSERLAAAARVGPVSRR